MPAAWRGALLLLALWWAGGPLAGAQEAASPSPAPSPSPSPSPQPGNTTAIFTVCVADDSEPMSTCSPATVRRRARWASQAAGARARSPSERKSQVCKFPLKNFNTLSVGAFMMCAQL